MAPDEAGTVPVGGRVALADRPVPRPPAGPRKPAPKPGKRPGSRRTGPGGLKGVLGFFSPKNMTWKRARRILYVLIGLAFLLPFLAFVIGWMIFKVPTAQDSALTQVATFTFADGSDGTAGKPIATVRPENVNRTIVTLDQIPLQVRQAVLAAEDESFYSNPGFDISGIGRAVYNQLTGGVGGGSTITQQYIKVTTGQDDFSLWRKYREVVLAVKITKEQTKDQLLENYLNTVYLGRGASGMQAAAQAYFHKDAKQLSVSEGALLAAAIQSPSKSDPATNLDRMTARWNYVLDRMVENGWLSPADRAQETFPKWEDAGPKNDGVPDDDRFHIYQQAVAELNAQGITEDDINTRGLTITTTIDEKRQIAAVDAMKDVLGDQPDNLRAALVSVDPKTGAIQAYYGQNPHGNGLGTDYAQAPRQAGSTFKPFVFTAGLQSGKDGIGLGKLYPGKSGITFPGGVKVGNSDGDSCDECTVKYAMTKSINTVFYQMGIDVGPQKVIDAAHAAGIPKNLLQFARGGIALGDQEVHPIDMASAFGTFAADGVHHQPYMVSKVVTADGEVLFQHQDDAGDAALSSQIARNVTESMVDVPTSSGIPLDGRPVAAKTGTVQKPGSTTGENKDAWTVGYTPTLSTAVWVGTDLSDAVKTKDGKNVFGRMLPGAIWQSFMKAALKGTPKEEFSDLVQMGTPLTDPVAQDDQGGQDGQDNGDDHHDNGDHNGDNHDNNNDNNNDNGNNKNDNNNNDGNNNDNNNNNKNNNNNNDGNNNDSNNNDSNTTFKIPGIKGDGGPQSQNQGNN